MTGLARAMFPGPGGLTAVNLVAERSTLLRRALGDSARFSVEQILSESPWPLARCRDRTTDGDVVVRYVAADPRLPGDITRVPEGLEIIRDLPEGVLLVAPYIAGPTLLEWMAREPGPDLIRQAAAIGNALFRALATLDHLNWVHGDVGPHNVILPDGADPLTTPPVLVGALWPKIRLLAFPESSAMVTAAPATPLRDLGVPEAFGRAAYVAPPFRKRYLTLADDYFAACATLAAVVDPRVRVSTEELHECALYPFQRWRGDAPQLWSALAAAGLVLPNPLELREPTPSIAPPSLQATTDGGIAVPMRVEVGVVQVGEMTVGGDVVGIQIGGGRPHAAVAAIETVEPPAVREDAQFTVYRPGTLTSTEWKKLLVYAHSSKREPDEEPDAPPRAVREQARNRLQQDFPAARAVMQDAQRPVPVNAELRLIPKVEGAEFNPTERSFRWIEDVHEESFKVRAAPGVPDGKVLRGTLYVRFGRLLLADVELTFQVGKGAELQPPVTAKAYRNIFVSYSHRDADVVAEVWRYQKLLGDRYLKDSISLRSGEKWSERLAELIRTAQLFQLFWSTNAMRSEFVAQEWRYALSLRRPQFVRPLYWETPMPADAALGLPPSELGELHFEPLEREAPARAAPTKPRPHEKVSPPEPVDPSPSVVTQSRKRRARPVRGIKPVVAGAALLVLLPWFLRLLAKLIALLH